MWSAIGFGVVTLQRPATDRAPWRDLVEVTGPVASPMGPAVLAGVRARTWLAEHDDEEVLATAWRCAEDVTEERHGRPGAADPSVILLRQGGGLRRAVRLDTAMAALVSVCDGELAAGQALAAIAELTGQDAGRGARAGAAGDPRAGGRRAARALTARGRVSRSARSAWTGRTRSRR